MVCAVRLGIFMVSLLALGCGKTSRNHSVGDAPGSGGTNGEDAAGETGRSNAAGEGSVTGGASGRGSGGSGVDGGASTTPELSQVQLVGAPIYTRVQRLTNRQWENAVTDILRFPAPHGLSEDFVRPVVGTTDFDNNEHVLFVDPTRFLDFELGAEAAAAIATGSADTLAALYDGDDAGGFIRTFGRRAFRRPLTADEEAKYQDVFALGEELYGAGFANGAALVIRAMLQSPHFLYRTELGPAGEPLDPYEVASKLSFWLLGTTPGDALLDAAGNGELDDEGLEARARQMLEEPGAVAVMRDFHRQLLHFDLYDSISKVRVPEYDAAIIPELGLVSYAFFDRVFQEGFGLREILTSKRAYVGPGLAPFYGMAPPADGLELRELGPARSGYFMQVPFLMLWGSNGDSDPIHRGLFLQAMLCAALPPPAAVVPSPPPLIPGETTRQRITRFTEECGETCHGVYIDPLGFAFESFDGLGRERRTDHGQPVDTSGRYPFAEGVQAFADGNELMNIMAGSAQVHTCYSKKLTGYALGRDLIEGDRPLLESLSKVSLSQSLKELIIALVRDPAFRTRQEALP